MPCSPKLAAAYLPTPSTCPDQGCIDGIYRIDHIVHQSHPSCRICYSIRYHHIRKEDLRRYEEVCHFRVCPRKSRRIRLGEESGFASTLERATLHRERGGRRTGQWPV